MNLSYSKTLAANAMVGSVDLAASVADACASDLAAAVAVLDAPEGKAGTHFHADFHVGSEEPRSVKNKPAEAG